MFKLFTLFLFISCFPLFGQWSEIGFPLTSEQVFCLLYEDNNIFAGTGSTQGIVYRTSNLGVSWEPAVNGLKGTETNAFYSYEDNGIKFIYAATDSGIFVTTDFGSNWTSLNISSSNQNFNSIFRIGDFLFAGSDSATYRSTNQGLIWNQINIDSLNSKAVEFELLDNDLYVLLNSPGNIIYRSSDNGLTWNSTNSDSLYFETLSSIEALDNNLYYIAYGRMSRTTNQGNTWERIGPSTWYPAVFAAYGDYLFIGGLTQVMYFLHKNSININLITTPFSFVSAIDVNSGLIVLAGQDNSSSEKKIWTRPTNQVTSVDDFTLPPDAYHLEQNYPNPFNPTTNIQFTIPQSSFATLEIFNALGERVDVLISEELNAGTYNFNWNGLSLTSGIYFYRLHAGSFIQTRKMILLR